MRSAILCKVADEGVSNTPGILSALTSCWQRVQLFTCSWAWSGNRRSSLSARSTSLHFIELLLSPFLRLDSIGSQTPSMSQFEAVTRGVTPARTFFRNSLQFG